jgi:hypothetical protein
MDMLSSTWIRWGLDGTRMAGAWESCVFECPACRCEGLGCHEMRNK